MWWIINYLKDRWYQLVEIIIRRRTAEGTQQCNIVASRSETRTETDEGHCVGLGAAHGGHQDIVP